MVRIPASVLVASKCLAFVLLDAAELAFIPLEIDVAPL
jgi:hypothetical protein